MSAVIVSYGAGDRVTYSPAYIANFPNTPERRGSVIQRNYGPLVDVRWEDSSVSYGVHHENLMKEAA